MFTGIIEETGVIRGIRPEQEGATLEIAAKTVPPTLKRGDSIAVNGVCLTAVWSGGEMFACELSAETLRLSSLGKATEGTVVNLERPLQLGGRLGGHIVQGHVDGVGKLISSKPSGRGVEAEFGFPGELERYLVLKGSISVDGISLTIAALGKSSFVVAVIPHTWEATNLARLKPGDPVNLEVDVLAKYFERFFLLGIIQDRSSALTQEYLKEQGF